MIARVVPVPSPPAQSVVDEVLLAVCQALQDHADAGDRNLIRQLVGSRVGQIANTATDEEYTPGVKIDEILVTTGVLCADMGLGPISNVQTLRRLRERLNNLLAAE